MKKVFILIGVIFLANFVIGCDQINEFISAKTKPAAGTSAPAPAIEDEPEGTKLVKVNSKIITYEEFEQNVKNLKTVVPDYKIDTFDTRKDLLNQMIDSELLYQEAKSRGIENRKEVKELIKALLKRAIVEQLRLDTTENVSVGAQEIEAFYNQYKDQLSEPEERRVQEIAVDSEDKARQISISLLQGENFKTLARDKSISESSTDGGDIGFIKKDERGEEYTKFDEIAFALDAGQISSIFKGPQGYYVVKIVEIKETKAKLLTDIWDDVKNSLLELKKVQRLQELIDKLRMDAKIEIVDELLK